MVSRHCDTHLRLGHDTGLESTHWVVPVHKGPSRPTHLRFDTADRDRVLKSTPAHAIRIFQSNKGAGGIHIPDLGSEAEAGSAD